MKLCIKVCMVMLAIVVVAGLIGCGVTPTKTTGSIALHLNNVQAKAISKEILPPIAMDVMTYTVTGIGPQGAQFDPVTVTAGGEGTINNLAPGSWNITAVGNNNTGLAIGAGVGTTSVLVGETSSLSITVSEYASPNGNYALTLKWAAGTVTTPSVTGILQSSAGTTVTPGQTFSIAGNQAAATNSLIPGWYTNIVQLKDSGTLVGGIAEAVRIAAAQTTSATVSLERTGGILITFIPDFADPLSLTGNPVFATPPLIAAVDITTAGPNNFSVNASLPANFFWYLNGNYLNTGSSINLDAGLIPIDSSARLDVVGFSTGDQGRHGGSGTWNVLHPGAVSSSVMGVVIDTRVLGDMQIQLKNQSGGSDVTYMVSRAERPNYPFSFLNVPNGNYVLFYRLANGDGSWADGVYWNPGNTGTTSLSSAAIIAIPNPAGTAWICNW